MQRAAAGALRTLAFKNDENKNQVMDLPCEIIYFLKFGIFIIRDGLKLNKSRKFMTLQIVECNALPTLILMLRSEDAAIHYEAVGSL